MKTKKIYKTPKCKAIKLDTEDLCDGMGIYSTEAPNDEDGNPIIGAKRGQYIYDDEAEENPEYEL